MIDYIEGLIEIKRQVAALEKACINREFDKAKECCYKIIVETRAVNHQLTIQGEK